MTRITPCVIAAMALGLSACTNPYDPVQHGVAGGLWGAASGAAIGAAVGGATGIFGLSAITSPAPLAQLRSMAYGFFTDDKEKTKPL